MVVKIQYEISLSHIRFIASNLLRFQDRCVNERTRRNIGYLPVVALDALVLLGLLDNDDLVDAALAGGSDGAEIKHLKDNTGIR